MKRILLIIFLVATSTHASTFIGNGGQTGDVELAVSLKQVRASVERIQTSQAEKSPQKFCVCPGQYADHSLCEVIKKLNSEQQKYCERFILSQASKLDRAAQSTQFEWVNTVSMVNTNKVGDRVVDAVARKDKKLIYIDQSRFVTINDTNRLFLLTHELFHMDSFEGNKLDDEDPIGPFTGEYGVRDLLNAAAAGIVLTALDQTVFQMYTRYLDQSRSSSHHWFGISTLGSYVEDTTNSTFKMDLNRGRKFTYHYQPESFFNIGFTVQLGNQEGSKSILSSSTLNESRSVFAAGISYRYFFMNHLEPFNHFWSTFLQVELLSETLSGKLNIRDNRTFLESSASSRSVASRVSVYIPMKFGFWVNTGLEFNDHKLYYEEFDYTLTSKAPTFYLGVSYGL